MDNFRTLERKNIILSAAERLSVGTLTLEVGAIGETVTVESRGTQVNVAETQHSGVITSTQIEQVQVLGRDVTSIMRLLPGVRYENTVDSLGMSFGTDVPERRRLAPRLEQRHRGRRGRQRGWRQQPHGAADQPRRDRRGQDPPEHLPRGIRAGGRWPGADRQQERRLGLPRQPLLLRPPREPERHQLLHQPRRRDETALPIQYSRRQHRRTGARPVEEAVLLLLDRGAARQPARAAAQLDDADRERAAGRLLADARLPGSAHQHQGPAARGRVQRADRRPGLLPREHHSGQPHQPGRPRAPENAAAGHQLRSRRSRRDSSTTRRRRTPKTRR